jgi:hypothetical protein
LQAPRALQHLDHDARALIGDLETTAPQARNGQKNVGYPIVEDDDAKAYRDVERLDDAAELDDAHGLLTSLTLDLAVDLHTAAQPVQIHFVRRHDTPTAVVSTTLTLGESSSHFPKIVIEKVANSTQRIGVSGYLFGESKLRV